MNAYRITFARPDSDGHFDDHIDVEAEAWEVHDAEAIALEELVRRGLDEYHWEIVEHTLIGQGRSQYLLPF